MFFKKVVYFYFKQARERERETKNTAINTHSDVQCRIVHTIVMYIASRERSYKKKIYRFTAVESAKFAKCCLGRLHYASLMNYKCTHTREKRLNATMVDKEGFRFYKPAKGRFSTISYINQHTISLPNPHVSSFPKTSLV